MHLAINIFDRVLVSDVIQTSIGVNRESLPLLILTSVILAAKVE
jgi:hypothetical protein